MTKTAINAAIAATFIASGTTNAAWNSFTGSGQPTYGLGSQSYRSVITTPRPTYTPPTTWTFNSLGNSTFGTSSTGRSVQCNTIGTSTFCTGN